jgi:Outer membrane lipoprotein-sorting protein
MIQRYFIACLLTILPLCASAAELSKAELEGRELAAEIVQRVPTEDSTVTGVLKVRDANHNHFEVSVRCVISLTLTNWQTVYETVPVEGSPNERIVITHDDLSDNRYEIIGGKVRGDQTTVPFAGSDFWAGDLGLEFLHWPSQTVLKKELRRGRSCAVLESSNPKLKSDYYSRVVAWIDRETGGIIHADAYDMKGSKLKEFEPKEFKKVNGQWQLQEMQIRNVQTGSRTQLEFELGTKWSDEPR